LLAISALFIASTVSSHAQTNWTGSFTSNWFLSGNWDAGFPRQTTDGNIDTTQRNATVISDPGALARNLSVGVIREGMLTIQNGGTLSDSFAAIGNLTGGVGTVTVTGAGSSWSTAGAIVVGGLGTGTLIIENGASAQDGVSSGGGSIGQSAGSIGTVIVTGAGSSWINGPQNGLNVGSLGTGTLMIENGGRVIDITPLASNIGSGAGGVGSVTVTGAGSLWSDIARINIGNSGTGTLTIADSGVVAAPNVVIAANAGSVGTLNIGAAAGDPAAAPGTLTASSVAFGNGIGTINFNHTSTNYVFAPAISGVGTVNVLAGTTIFTGANSYNGTTNIGAGTLRAGAANTFSANSAVSIAGAGTLDLNGFNQTVLGVTNAGLVNMGTSTAPGTVLTMTSYAGAGGTIAMNTFLGGDGSPSDKLVINGGTATGNSFLHIINAGGPGAETVGNGIAVVQAINGGRTTSAAFALAGEVRGGAFDYDLFRGGLSGSNPNDWFLRSTFVVGPIEPPIEPPILPPDPPTGPLPPGIYPIIGPEIATYGVVQPIARQLGMTMLGTLHERVGDTLLGANNGAPCPADGDTRDPITAKAPAKPADCLASGWWGRVLGQQINNRYTAFADPRASGQLLGFQSGIDLWRSEWMPGHRDAAGIYFGYANAGVDVSGLVTNAAVNGYVLSKTGSLSLEAWSGGAYWTHYGPSDWYLDAVAQVTRYGGTASTQFAGLPTDGFGFLSSLEAGYPIPLPRLGPGFVLEPEAQIVWQQVSFNSANDGLGDVALGTTSGASGRIGLRGRWTIVSEGGQVWQPYVRSELWRDWGAQATTIFSGADLVPLLEQATRVQLGGGLSVRMDARTSFYANADYQFAVAGTDGGRRDGIRGAAGVRLTW
jgi:outer membrane autotransporter protein